MYSFTSLSQFNIKNRGTVYTVENLKTCENFIWIINKKVKIDDLMYTVVAVVAVGRFMHSPPWMEGEKIGLLVK